MPVFKKALGKIYGIEFSKAEKEAMEKELRSQMTEYDRMHENEIDAMMLLALHKLAGFGPKRLKEFYCGFQPMLKDVMQQYDCGTSEIEWVCTQALKDYGIDISEWRTELEENQRENA